MTGALFSRSRKEGWRRYADAPARQRPQQPGYEQAEAEFCLTEAGEAAAALSPPARGEVIAEAAHSLLLGQRPKQRRV